MRRSALLLYALLLACSPRPSQDRRVLWQEPRTFELARSGGFSSLTPQPPRPPFQFLSEDPSGTSPKLLVRDAASAEWRVKGGPESRAETFSTRFVSALGYYAQPTWYVQQGRVEGAGKLQRASAFVQPDGSFSGAAFELRDPRLELMTQDWAWNANPFQNTRELHGLKILIMLLSNWDNKDARNRTSGSNTGILTGRSNGRVRFIYFVNDWGQTLGAWGTEQRPKGWDCEAFTAETPSFVQGREGDTLRFGFAGQHTADFKSGITVEDVRWLLRYLGPITEPQIRSMLSESGATAAEANCFAAALASRVGQLRAAATR